MSNKAQYQTKQRDELLTYLESMSGQHITVNDVCEYFKSKGKSIGTTTVYRQLEKMVDQGIVTKYVIDAGSPACFEYVSPDKHVHGSICFHLRCEICGRLIHMQCDELSSISTHIMKEHGFRVDPMRTVFYGICQDCMTDDEEGKKLCH